MSDAVISTEQLFSQRIVKISSGCWLWQGGIDNPRFTDEKGRRLSAIRYAWTKWRGPIKSKAWTRKTCNTLACVNPFHRELASTLETTEETTPQAKRCAYCKETKQINEFWVRSNGLIHSLCKDCDYKTKTARSLSWKNANTLLLTEFYKNGCLLCGMNVRECLQAHHIVPIKHGGNQVLRDGKTKEVNRIADYRWRVSPDRFVKELEKCIPLCANCHLLVHHNKIEFIQEKNGSVVQLLQQ